MDLRVERHIFTEHSTIGKLFISGEFNCFTLEPAWRTDDIKPRAIPEGTYNLVIRYSEKHRRTVPGIQDVPGFSDIEIHPGNGPQDTEGCLLVGEVIGPERADWISQSEGAFYSLMEVLLPASEKKEPLTITYRNVQGATQ